ncbi:MAG: hypothetical protein Q7U47_13435 [Paludibacter sp.]|nr:hypothetical protein [Paludibacter sp.]
MFRTNLAIGLISAAIIAFQLVLMQILSYIQWYHFAYMIISVALLGFGAAGTFLTVFRKKLQRNYALIFPLLLFITGILMSIVVIIANTETVRFDSLLIFHDFRYAGRLVATYFIFFLPFFTGALAIGMSFLKFAGKIGKIYFSNLVGSGIGGIIALLLMQFVLPQQLPLIIAVIALAGGFVSFPKNAGKLLQSVALVSIVVLPAVLFIPYKLKPSEYKDISKTLLLPDATVEYEKSSPYGLVQVVSSPVLRYAPGVSLGYRGTFSVQKAVFNNGNWNGFLIPATDREETSILDFTPQSLPYQIAKNEKVLILDAATGENVALALSHNVTEIVATEANAAIFSLLQHSFATYDQVKLRHTLSRTFLVSDTSGYQLIELPVIGSFFGNSGLNAVESHFELSIEAFHDMWDRLADNGMISVSCWMDYPVRNAYRLLAVIDRLLKEKKIKHPEKHIIAIRSWCAVAFFVNKSEFSRNQEIQAQQFCNDMMFDPLLMPGSTAIDTGSFNVLQDTSFFRNIKRLLSSEEEKNAFFKEYPYRIQPVTDNRPFFFQHIRWSGIQQVISSFRKGGLPFLELGYLLVLFTFVQILFIAGFFIIVPLFFKRWKSKDKFRVFFYFSGIGLAYMFVEIVFIQHFTFYFGQAIYAAAASISMLLIASGLGSYYSVFLQITKKILFLIPIIIGVVLLIYSFLLPTVLSLTIGVALPLKIFISIVLTGIPGFLLGIPFPAGIKYLSEKRQADIPRAWAFNGYFSVISTALATIIAVEAGYVLLLLIAGVTYALAGLSYSRQKN